MMSVPENNKDRKIAAEGIKDLGTTPRVEKGTPAKAKALSAAKVNKKQTDIRYQKRQAGICELCASNGMVNMVNGKRCCSTCEPIRRNAKLRPELMRTQLLELNPDMEIKGEPVNLPAETEAQALAQSRLDEIKRLHLVIQEMEEGGLSLGMPGETDRLRSVIKILEKDNKELEEKNGQLRGLTTRLAGAGMIRAEAGCQPGYEALHLILTAAMEQAATGKGLERHGDIGVPFVSQPICTIARDVGLGFPLGQALKKIRESKRLAWPAARRELLGAIVYTAAAVIVADDTDREFMARSGKNEVTA